MQKVIYIIFNSFFLQPVTLSYLETLLVESIALYLWF